MAEIQLFILPFAGGNAASFQKFIEMLDSRIEAVPVEYAGRGVRGKEAYLTLYDDFLADIQRYISERRNRDIPYALLGYSMGCAIAYDLAVRGEIDGELQHIFYCASGCVKNGGIRKMSDEEFLEHAKTLGGFNERIIKNKRLFHLFVHPLIDDYRIARQYEWNENNPLLCPATVIYAETDTPFSQVETWKELSTNNTKFYTLGENHFFLFSHSGEMAGIVNRELIGEGRT